MFDGFVFILKTSHAGCGAAEFSHHRRIPRRIPNHFDLETIQAAVARSVLIAGIAASGSGGLDSVSNIENCLVALTACADDAIGCELRFRCQREHFLALRINQRLLFHHGFKLTARAGCRFDVSQAFGSSSFLNEAV
jgi:hypothetical protein